MSSGHDISMSEENICIRNPSGEELAEEYGALSWSITAENDSDAEHDLPGVEVDASPGNGTLGLEENANLGALHLRPERKNSRARSRSMCVDDGQALEALRKAAAMAHKNAIDTNGAQGNSPVYKKVSVAPKPTETTENVCQMPEEKKYGTGLQSNNSTTTAKDKDTRPEWYEELSEEQVSMFKEVFELLDRDGGGSLDAQELFNVMQDMQLDVTKDEIEAVLKELDKDGNGEIDFDEFLYTMCDTARLIDLMATDPERASREDVEGYSRRQRLFFTAITRFAIKNSMGEIERYYASKMRQAPHVISFYTAGVRLIGLNDRQLELRLRKMQKEARGQDSPYAKPLPFVTVRPRKKKNKDNCSKDDSSPLPERPPVSRTTPKATKTSHKETSDPRPKTASNKSNARPAAPAQRARSGGKPKPKPQSLAAQKLNAAFNSFNSSNKESNAEAAKPTPAATDSKPAGRVAFQIPEMKEPEVDKFDTIGRSDLEKLDKYIKKEDVGVEYVPDFGKMNKHRKRGNSLPFAWEIATHEQQQKFDEDIQSGQLKEPQFAAVQLKESTIGPLPTSTRRRGSIGNDNEDEMLSAQIAGSRRHSLRRRTAIHSDSLEYGEVMKLLNDLAKNGSVVAKLPDVHLVPGIRNRLAAMSGESQESSIVDPLCSSVRRRRRTMTDNFDGSGPMCDAPNGQGRKNSRFGKQKRLSKTTQGWAIPRYIRSRPPLPVIPLAGAHNMSKYFTVDDVPMVRAKVSKALGKYYDKLKNAYVRTDWTHWDHLNKFITSEKLRENFKQVYCAYSPHQVENVFVITPWIPGPRYTSRQPGKAITHQGNPPRSSSCVPPAKPHQNMAPSRPGSSML